MLHLASQTSAAWLERARTHLDDVLLDHAHCEKKAAGAAVKLLFSYPHHRFLQEPLAALAREELVHFEQVLARLDARGIAYRTIRPGPYGMALHALTRGDEPDRLVDMLLVSALIEARSCERMQRLAEVADDEELAAFYRGLHAAEARHHGLYLELARELAPPPTVNDRFAELAEREAAILTEPTTLCRMHT